MQDGSATPAGSASDPSAAGAQPVDGDLSSRLASRVVGQPAAWQSIVPYLHMYQAGLAPAGRPAGIFLLLGPSGTGKTRTVEALAEVLHGESSKLLKVDCGEYQSDHEVAKLIGAPPGYLGHRDTTPLLTRDRLRDATSSSCGLSLVLFDEIEKAAPSLGVLLLGILDKALLRLGDNTVVNFENTLIFLTSNLGGREMMREMAPNIGFQPADRRPAADVAGKLEAIALAAVRRRFSPEFVNRIDVIITYRPLDAEALAAILGHHVDELQRHVNTRLGERSFDIEVEPAAREWLLRLGTSAEYGARELKRTIHRHLTQPLAALVAAGQVPPGSRVRVGLLPSDEGLDIRCDASAITAVPVARKPTVLVVDDNASLLQWLSDVLGDEGFRTLLATSAGAAGEHLRAESVDLVLLDMMLPDGDGVRLGSQLRRQPGGPQVVIITGMELSPDEALACERQDMPVLRKPFLGHDVVALVRARLRQAREQARHAGQG